MTFHVGMKVVCVDNIPRAYPPCELRDGAIYTVREVVPCWDGIDGLFLDEVAISAPGGFCSTRFRPPTDIKTEVSFTVGADPETEQFDNRRKSPAKVGV